MIDQKIPLAERMRPRSLDEIIGRDDVIGRDTALGKMLRSSTGSIPSLILWGPPGTGKTTLARVIASESKMRFVRLSGVLDGVKEIRQAVSEAEREFQENGNRTLALVDEIHRFNRSQQDAFLPHVESGLLNVIGQTTDNVSFRLTSALLSRMRVVSLPELTRENILEVVDAALVDERGLPGFSISEDARNEIARLCGGDARRALNALEWASVLVAERDSKRIEKEDVISAYGEQPLNFDQAGDQHYDYISALIKSMRGSSPDAAVYYLLRALEGGEDPLFISRRLIIFASEDASCDPRALDIAVNVDAAIQRVGMPEGKISLSHAVCYLASCPKSNASYRALRKGESLLREYPELTVPKHLRNAPTDLMKKEGYGLGYKYPHDYPGAFVKQDYLPQEISGTKLYEPGDQGVDAAIKERLQRLWGTK